MTSIERTIEGLVRKVCAALSSSYLTKGIVNKVSITVLALTTMEYAPAGIYACLAGWSIYRASTLRYRLGSWGFDLYQGAVAWLDGSSHSFIIR